MEETKANFLNAYLALKGASFIEKENDIYVLNVEESLTNDYHLIPNTFWFINQHAQKILSVENVWAEPDTSIGEYQFVLDDGEIKIVNYEYINWSNVDKKEILEILNCSERFVNSSTSSLNSVREIEGIIDWFHFHSDESDHHLILQKMLELKNCKGKFELYFDNGVFYLDDGKILFAKLEPLDPATLLEPKNSDLSAIDFALEEKRLIHIHDISVPLHPIFMKQNLLFGRNKEPNVSLENGKMVIQCDVCIHRNNWVTGVECKSCNPKII
jgi:hypothetical protein